MKKILFLLAILPIFVFTACSSDDEKELVSLSISENNINLYVGETLKLRYFLSNSTKPSHVEWDSSDIHTVAIDNNGMVRALKAGMAVVSVSVTVEGKTLNEECIVNVLNVEATNILLNLHEKEINVGESFNLNYKILPDNTTNKSVIWKSDNQKVASVTDGIVKAWASGTANISINVNGTNIYDVCKVSVLPDKLKWYAGTCNSIPANSNEVKSLPNSGVYNGIGSYNFYASPWRIIAICIPTGHIWNLSLTSYPGNFIEDTGITKGPINISVNTSQGNVDYKMWIVQTPGLNDADTFTFKTK